MHDVYEHYIFQGLPYTFDDVIDVVTILGTVIFEPIIFVKFDVLLTTKFPVNKLLLVTVVKIEVPVTCNEEVDIFVARTLATNKLVVVCVVLFISGTTKFVLTCILPVLRLLLLTVPRTDIFVTLRFEIVDVFAISLLKITVELE